LSSDSASRAQDASAVAAIRAEGLAEETPLIAAGQRVEHYEMACYGAVRHLAEILGESSDASLIEQTLKEERHADHLLTQIADRVNPSAQKAA
jgi:ferritin-like metal-binding protein YciE